MNKDIEKELRGKLVEFVEFAIRSETEENLEDLEFVVLNLLQASKSLGLPEELLASNEVAILEVYQKLKKEREAASTELH